MINGYTSGGSGYEDAGVFLDEEGFINVVGVARNGTGTIAYLPKGMRPSKVLDFYTPTYNGSAYINNIVTVFTDGRILPNNSGASIAVGLNHIRFRAEQ
jgi:hypothetical protein